MSALRQQHHGQLHTIKKSAFKSALLPSEVDASTSELADVRRGRRTNGQPFPGLLVRLVGWTLIDVKITLIALMLKSP
jgi:hypothetical protein